MNTIRPTAPLPTVERSGRPQRLRAEQGFTLVELMLALTGGLFVSLVVFALARDGSRFYQRESRVAEATLGNLIGFERLRNDIARAGFLATPNIQRDATYCRQVNDQLATFPLLRALASIQITAADNSVTGNAALQAASPAITPHNILLTGAYSSVEKFDIWETTLNNNQYQVRLQSARGPLARMNWVNLDLASQLQLLVRLFPPRRALRIYSNDFGTFQIGVISGTNVINGSPTILLDPAARLILRGQGTVRCHASVNQQVNVINIIRYALRDVRSSPATDYPGYQTLFTDSSVPIPGENTRLELVREELDADGNVVLETREVIAEYAVDLRFAVTRVDNPLLNAPQLITDDFDSANVLSVAGSILGGNANANPQYIRSIRARLSVRSREADRDANIDTAAANIAPGLYRIGLGENGQAPFARVRTLQADTFISSHAEIRW